MLVNNKKRSKYVLLNIVFMVSLIFSQTSTYPDSSFMVIRNMNKDNPLPSGIILSLNQNGGLKDITYTAPQGKKVNKEDIHGKVVGRPLNSRGRIFLGKPPFKFEASPIIVIDDDEYTIKKIEINFNIGMDKNYIPKTYDPTENGEKFFKLDRHCKVNGKYPALLEYEINENSKILITSVKFNESEHETPGSICDCVNVNKCPCASDERTSTNIKVLKFKNTFESEKNKVTNIRVYAECGNKGEKVELTKGSKNNCIMDKNETCEIEIPDMCWKKLIYTFDYNSKRIDGKEVEVTMNGKNEVVIMPFYVDDKTTKIGNNNLPGEKLTLNEDLVNRSDKMTISYSFKGTNKVVTLEPKVNKFTLQDYYGDITNLMVDGQICKVNSVREIVKIEEPTMVILDLNSIGRNTNKKKEAGYYELASELYTELSSQGVHFYKFINTPVEKSSYNRFKIRNIHVNHSNVDEDEYEMINKEEYTGFLEYLEENELLDTKRGSKAWEYYFSFESIHSGNEINVSMTPDRKEDMESKKYLMKFTENVADNGLISSNFSNVYYISYNGYDGNDFIDKNEDGKYDENDGDIRIKPIMPITYLSLRDKDSDDEDPQVISLEKLLEQIKKN